MLHLLPNFLAEDCDAKKIFPPSIYEVFPTLDVLIVETPKQARAYLKRLLTSDPETYKRLLSLPMKEYNEHTTDKQISELLEKSKNFAYLSDAGLPCIADPGYKLVKLAKDLGIEVLAHVGPSSVILALMLSGMNAASFTFYGYFPRQLSDIQAMMAPQISSHVFIETPYRNEKTLETLLTILKPSATLCVALDLTGQNQEVHRYTVSEWRKKTINVQKRPAVYVISP